MISRPNAPRFCIHPYKTCSLRPPENVGDTRECETAPGKGADIPDVMNCTAWQLIPGVSQPNATVYYSLIVRPVGDFQRAVISWEPGP